MNERDIEGLNLSTRRRPGMKGKKLGNRYAAHVAHIEAPKAVWQAIAFSLAMRIREDHEALAAVEVFEEWRILHENGIVPQRPRSRRRPGKTAHGDGPA